MFRKAKPTWHDSMISLYGLDVLQEEFFITCTMITEIINNLQKLRFDMISYNSSIK